MATTTLEHDEAEELTSMAQLGAEAREKLLRSMYLTQKRDAKSSIQRWTKALEPFKDKGYGFYLLAEAVEEVESCEGYSRCALYELFPYEAAHIREVAKLASGEDPYADDD